MARNGLSATGSDESPLQLPKQRRAPAPILSPQHIALARSLPHSRTSTPTPSLLTPPVSGTPNMSPPPRLEADDYMNVHGHDHHDHKKQHPKKRSRKIHNTREGSEGSRPPQRSLRSGPQTAASIGSDCELCAADISDGDEETSSNAPLLNSLGRPNLRSHLHNPREIAEPEVLHTQTSPAVSPSIVDVDEPESLAVNALRSLSFQAPKRSNSQGLRRVSTALASSLNLFRTKPTVSFAAVPSHNASRKAEKASRKSSAHSKSLVYQDINRRRPTFKEGKDDTQALGTPATITLRKASNLGMLSLITTSMSASLAHEAEHKRAADAPASELLAFYSSPALENRPTLTNLPTPESAEAPRSPRRQPTFTFEEEPQPSRKGSKSASQLSNIHNTRQSSMPAEAALTFTDVHVAPGSFSVGPKSRKQSLVPAEVGRRISIVQFRSRNSVHEVIWREDETTSDSSLTVSSRDSPPVGHSFRSTPSPQSGTSPTRKSTIEPRETKSLLATVPESVSKFTKMPENLVRWTWGTSSNSVEDKPQAVLKSDTSGHAAEGIVGVADARGDPLGLILVNDTSDPTLASLQQSSDQQDDSRSQRPSFSKLSSVQSFPPLRPRSSTAEWRKAPLVDPNDPLASRVPQRQVQLTNPSAGLRTGAGSGITRGKKSGSSQLYGAAENRRSSVPRGIARLGSVGSVGFGIGASSRKRVLSRRKS